MQFTKDMYCAGAIVKLTTAELASLHTKQLLRCHRIMFQFAQSSWETSYHREYRRVADEIRSILNTREHVTTKLESKAKRVAKIHTGV